MLTIIDYGMGNLGSVKKAFQRINVEAQISSDPAVIAQAGKLVLPGVGHFKKGMENLSELKLIEVLDEKVLKQKCPILGICLGMQLFTQSSEEGDVKGLGYVGTHTKAFPESLLAENLKIPHMGWNSLQTIQAQTPILTAQEEAAKFYFVHSYYVEICPEATSTAFYGIDVCASLQNGNVFGTQFHPEKSHDAGLQLLQNFVNFQNV